MKKQTFTPGDRVQRFVLAPGKTGTITYTWEDNEFHCASFNHSVSVHFDGDDYEILVAKDHLRDLK